MRFSLDIEFIDFLQPDPLESRLIYCKGGGGSGVDRQYNARMASIYEEQNKWATKFNQFWEDYEKPYEQAKIEANQKQIEGETALSMEETAAKRGLLPGQTELAEAGTELGLAQTKSAMGLVPLKSELEREQTLSALERTKLKRPVQQKYFKEALEGVDADSWAASAQADAAQAFLSSTSGTKMAMARRGATPGSGAYAGKANESAMGRAMHIGNAATSGRESGERESFNRLQSAISMGG